MNDTITAISTPVGESAIGIIRISGRETFSILKKILKSKKFEDIGALKFPCVIYGKIYDEKQLIDEVIVNLFKAPNSYTGEDVAEISCHGNPFLLKRVLDIIVSNGARIARPGEFTMRSYLNGKMDLLKAEAINDLIRAHTKYSHLSAIAQLSGKLSAEINSIEDELLDILSLIEASIDHSDLDETFLPYEKLIEMLQKLKERVERLLSTSTTGKITSSGIKVVLAGAPNTGKSTLMNTLLKEDRVIVSDIPGTTRDVIADEISVRGIPVRLFDTAGIRNTEDILERRGIEMSQRVIENADLIFFILDASREIMQEDIEIFERIRSKNFIILLNKIDLNIKTSPQMVEKNFGISPISISAISPESVVKIEDEIEKFYFSYGFSPENDVLITNQRQEDLLKRVLDKIKDAIHTARNGLSEEFVSSELRIAKKYLEEITGKVFSDEILDRIFARFCIGK